MKKYIAEFEVPDEFRPGCLYDGSVDGWFENDKGETVRITTNFIEKPQVKCEECDFRKFTETFIDGVVDVMNKNGITSVEQLSEILRGGAEK